MKTIWKFPFGITDRQYIEMPMGAQILAVQVQGEQPCIWALVESGAQLEHRDFHVVETGRALPDYDDLQYRGTLHMFGDRVFHVFELVPRPSRLELPQLPTCRPPGKPRARGRPNAIGCRMRTKSAEEVVMVEQVDQAAKDSALEGSVIVVGNVFDGFRFYGPFTGNRFLQYSARLRGPRDGMNVVQTVPVVPVSNLLRFLPGIPIDPEFSILEVNLDKEEAKPLIQERTGHFQLCSHPIERPGKGLTERGFQAFREQTIAGNAAS